MYCVRLSDGRCWGQTAVLPKLYHRQHECKNGVTPLRVGKGKFESRCWYFSGREIEILDIEILDLYCSPNIVRVVKSRRMRWAEHVARMGEEMWVYRVLVGKPEGRRPLGRPRRRWVDK